MRGSEDLSGESILGLDNIRLELPVAGPGSRVLAATLDYLLLTLVMALWVVGGLVLLDPIGGWGLAVVIAGVFLLEYGYFIGCEIAFDGRTPGKMALKLRVVTREGGRAGPGALALRNLLRLADLVVGVLLMALDPWSRRLGDRIAGTLVVHQVREGSELAAGRVPEGWSAQQVAVAESFLRRRGELEPDQARHLARRILAWVERDAPHFLTGTNPEVDPVGALVVALGAEGVPA